jgi:hypothetical protein
VAEAVGEVKRYSAKEREEAAVLCSILAADRANGCGLGPDDLAAPSTGSLAWIAYAVVDRAYPISYEESVTGACAMMWAEAEAWLRSGWSPGDTWTAADRKRAGLK